MKKTLNLLLLLWMALLAACSADEPQTVSPTEEYNREFVKEFGVPAQGHDFSMATTAGLKVTSAAGDHITVTAEIDGVEYLFADCHVPAGTTAVPVTIPRNVSQLKLATTRGTRTVAANATVNLDEIESPVMHLAAPESGDDAPWLLFHYSDFLKDFMQKDNSAIKYHGANYNYSFRRCETDKGYIFPVYWRKDKDGFKDYSVRFTCSKMGLMNDIKSIDIAFDDSHTATNPFPELKTHYYSDIEVLNPSNSDMCFRPQESWKDAFNNNPPTYKIILSRGIRVEDYLEALGAEKNDDWYLEVSYNHDGEECSMVSENPYRNIGFWNGFYYDVPLKYLNTAHHGAFVFSGGNKFYLYDDKLEGATQVSYFKELSTYGNLIGFNTAPTSVAFGQQRDYADVVFLYIPLSKYAGGAISSSPVYEWTIAAEDLGGTDDWDFNDVVFSFTDVIKDLNSENDNSLYRSREWGPRDAEPVRVITVTPKAAGGTMPVYITYIGKVAKVPEIPDGKGESADVMYSQANQAIKDYMSSLEWAESTYIVGKEVHAWLGADSYKTMVNTGATNQTLKVPSVEFTIPVETQLGVGYDPASGSMNKGSYMASVANKSLAGFAIIVDKENTLGIDAMNDSEQGMHRAENLVLGQGMYVIGRPDASKGEVAPQMILLPGTKWKWPQERVNIGEAYPDFAKWLANPDAATNWSSNYIKDKVTY